MDRKIIVTGANGQLGSELKNLSLTSAFKFVFTDIDTLDLSDDVSTINYLDRESPEIIINCAAFTAVDRAEQERDLAEKLNASLPAMLGEFCLTTGAKLIHLSTDYVFPGNGNIPYREDDPTGPGSVYGLTKLQGEIALKDNPNAMIIRTSWLYSSFGNNFVKTMLRMFKEREMIRVVNDQFGSPTYASDLAAAILTIIQQADNKKLSGIYHYTNEGYTSWYEFACTIRDLSASACRIIPIPTEDYPLPAKRPAYSVLSKNKIRKDFNIEPPLWKDSLKKCIDILNH